LSTLLASVAVAAFGFAGGVLGLGLLKPPAEAFVLPKPEAIVEAKLQSAIDLPNAWPAVFGDVPLVAEPEPEPEIIAEPEVIEEPPQENTTYFLTGLVAGRGNSSWAMISENDRGLVVRVGDTLIGGELVTDITAEGVWLEFEGVRELIPLQKTDLAELVRFERTAPANEAPSEMLAEVTIVMEAMDRQFVEDVISEAGELALTPAGMDVLRIRQGQLFQQMGLRAGDTIVSVNGAALTSQTLLGDMPDADVLGAPLQFEILRDGSRQMVRVTLDQG